MGSSASQESPIKSSSTNRTRNNIDLEGFPARVDNINVSGLGRTYDDYITRAVRNIFKAKTFKDVLLEVSTSTRNLEELGIFKNLRARIDVSRGSSATENGYEVSFDGVELSRVTGKIGTEIGQNEGAITTELASPNIFGRGERVSVQGSYSNHKNMDFNIKLTKPFYHTRMGDYKPEATVILTKYSSEFPWSKYRTQNTGIIFETSFMLPVQVFHNFQYEVSMREIHALAKQVPFFVRKQCGPRMATVFRYILAIDQRDSTVFPTKGAFFRSTNEVGGLTGGDVSYISNNTHVEVNVPLFAGISTQFCTRVGVITAGKLSPTIPINNLFILGGPQTIRGFMMGGAGQHEDSAVTGAQTYLAGGAHLWSPLPFFGTNGLANFFRIHLFFTCGKTNSLSLTAADLLSSYGAGLAIRLGEKARIELNYCQPLVNRNLQYFKKGFQFGLGYDFM